MLQEIAFGVLECPEPCLSGGVPVVVVAHFQAMREGCDLTADSLELGVELVAVHAGTTLYPLPIGESTGITRFVGTTTIPSVIRSSGRLPR